MKKIIFTLILLLIPNIILANEIYSIDIDIHIDNNGTANVKEVWKTNLTSGTEGYKPYYNLGSSTISNFKVKLNNTEYTFKDNYNINATFNEKKYTNGFNYISNGIELCFGISEYGKNTYTLSYNISNFVVNTSDGYQMLYWTLFPKNYNPEPAKVHIKIYSDFKYSDTLDVWGYGKGNVPTYVYDGIIEMDSESKVSSSEYMTILVKYPKDTFNLNTTLNNTFNYYLDMANSGTKNDHIILKTILSSIIKFLKIMLSIAIFKYCFLYRFRLDNEPYGVMKMKFSFSGKRLGKVEYNRDLPYSINELSRVYWLAAEYNMIKDKNDYLSAVLLKWLKQGNITIQNNTIILNNNLNLSNRELDLYETLSTVSRNNIITKETFKNWCNYNYYKIIGFLEDVMNDETIKLINEGKLVRMEGTYTCYVNDITKSDARLVKGVKKFLNDFSKIKDRYPLEVHIWNEYLMYATIFGISKKVLNSFDYLYPNIIPNNFLDNLITLDTVTSSGLKIAQQKYRKEMKKSDRNKDIFSSGGGGSSSSGGGRGSFGGGSGGGGFR